MQKMVDLLLLQNRDFTITWQLYKLQLLSKS